MIVVHLHAFTFRQLEQSSTVPCQDTSGLMGNSFSLIKLLILSYSTASVQLVAMGSPATASEVGTVYLLHGYAKFKSSVS